MAFIITHHSHSFKLVAGEMYCDVPGSPCLSKKKANQMCDSFLFKFLYLWTDQRIPGPVSCLCTSGSLETPPRWHATVYTIFSSLRYSLPNYMSDLSDTHLYTCQCPINFNEINCHLQWCLKLSVASKTFKFLLLISNPWNFDGYFCPFHCNHSLLLILWMNGKYYQ